MKNQYEFNSLGKLVSGINALIEILNHQSEADIQKLSKPALSQASQKITELGSVTKTGIVGSNSLKECADRFQDLIEKVITDNRDEYFKEVERKYEILKSERKLE